MKEMWISVGDNRVCPDCEGLAGEIRDHAEWETEGLPGSVRRGTLCGDACRCILVEAPNEEEQEMLEELTEKVIKKIELGIDETKGYKITLKEYADVSGLMELPYKEVARFEDLIRQYNADVGTLPKEFYDLKDIRKQTKWLEGKL